MFKKIAVSTFTIILSLFLTACTVKNYKRFDQNQDHNRTITTINDTQYEQEKLFEWKIAKGDRVLIQAYAQSSSSSGGQLNDLLSRGSTDSQGPGLLIGNQGTVQLPLIGSIKILGLTENQASKKISDEYRKYLKNPYVVVQLLNQKLFVLGEVKQPGVVEISHGTISLLEVLARSGDITEYADRTKIKIIRGSMRNPIIHEIDLTDFNKLHYSSLILQPNDLVYVTARDSKVSAAGYQEATPFWELIGTILSPISQAAILYGAVQ